MSRIWKVESLEDSLRTVKFDELQYEEVWIQRAHRIKKLKRRKYMNNHLGRPNLRRMHDA